MTSFIGRTRELAVARKKLADVRLLSLVGAGGVGKTRLALRLATGLGRGFRDGAWLVELGELSDPTLVGNATLAALDLRDQTGAEPMDLLLPYLRNKQLLLVIDNCEHLIEAAAGLVDAVLKGAAAVRVIVTSREPLAVAGEHVLPVPTLPTGESPHDAIRLFAERAAAASGGFELTDANQAVVAELCRRLDGLPLAIELAAVRTRALGPEQILDRLSDRFALLTGSDRAVRPRQHTLRATLEWSFDLLRPVERTLLARLAVFAGRFTLADVEAVCCFGDLPAALGLEFVTSLIEKSLMIREEGDGTAVYRLHETTREYARLKLSEDGDQDSLHRRYADYYLSRCARFAGEGRYRLLEWLAWMDPQIENIRPLLRLSADRGDSTLATSLVWYWITRATSEGARCLDQLLARGPADPWAYFVRGFLAVLQSDPVAAVPVLEQGVTAARAARQTDALCQLLAMASIAAHQAGDRSSSRRFLNEADALAAVLEDLSASLLIHQAEALNALNEGELDRVQTAAAAGERLSRQVGDEYSLTMMLLNQGYAALRAGDLRQAEERFTEALVIASRLDDRVAQCHLLGGLGACAALSDPRRAARLLGAMESLRAEIGAVVNPGMAPALSSARRTAKSALGAARFNTELLQGERLSRGAAVRVGLRQADPPVAQSDREGVLGQRETDVAQLVAQGLSNKDVGSRLFISERTVETHVRNILNKLGFTSRAQIAGWMAAPKA